MTRTARASFEITRWDAESYDSEAAGPALKQVAVGKTFSGDLIGTSTARLLPCSLEGGEGARYVASDRVVGQLDGRAGSFILQHGGLTGGGGEAGPSGRSFRIRRPVS